jgi:endonuclease YncB( thermonuclease family)
MDDEFKLHGGGNTPDFSLKDVKTVARVVSIYDGDTMKVVIPLFGGFHKFSVRLLGIDACEIRATDPLKRAAAERARDRLIQLVTGHLLPSPKKKDVEKLLDESVALVWLECGEFDKWGRVLVRAFPHPRREEGVSFSDTLLEERLAAPYGGGRRT